MKGVSKIPITKDGETISHYLILPWGVLDRVFDWLDIVSMCILRRVHIGFQQPVDTALRLASIEEIVEIIDQLIAEVGQSMATIIAISECCSGINGGARCQRCQMRKQILRRRMGKMNSDVKSMIAKAGKILRKKK